MAKAVIEDYNENKVLGKRAVIYARYSSDKQKEASIPQQIEKCQEYIDRQGYETIRIYSDAAKSASHSVEKRTEFIRLLKDAESDDFDVVVFYALNRVSREENGGFYAYKKVFTDNCKRLEYATERYDEDNGGAITEAVQVTMSAEYVKQLRKYTVRGMRDNACKGLFNGGFLPPGIKLLEVGKSKCYVRDDVVSEFIAKAFDMYIHGSTTREIADYLNNQGLRNGKGNKISQDNVRQYLSEPLYVGKTVTVFDNKEAHQKITTVDVCEPTVTEEVWERAQIEKSKRVHRGGSEKAKPNYILLGKLYCGECGEYMITDSGTSRSNNKNKTPGGKFYYYACRRHKRKQENRCKKKNVRKEFIENAVLQLVSDYIWEEDKIQKYASALREYENNREENQRKREIQTELKRQRNELQISKDAYKKTLNDTWLEDINCITARIKELETELNGIKKIEEREMSVDDFIQAVNEMREAWDKLRSSQKGRKSIIDNYVERVYIYDEELDRPGKLKVKLVIKTDDDSDYDTELSADVDMTSAADCSRSSLLMEPGSPAKKTFCRKTKGFF